MAKLVRVIDDNGKSKAVEDAYAHNYITHPSLGNPTLEDVADYLDNYAEDVNYHEFVGVHRVLAVVLLRKVGRQVATEIMEKIAEFEGLHMIELGNRKIFKQLGIPDCWADWDAATPDPNQGNPSEA